MRRLLLTSGQMALICDHAAACLPDEACGLLAGRGEVVHEVLPVTNAAHSPVRFRMDPMEQLNALNRIDLNRLELLAIFHSHPAGPTVLSETDIREAAYEVIQVLLWPDNGKWRASGYWIDERRPTEVELHVADLD